MFRLIRFLKPYKKQVLLGPLFKLTEAVFELIVPLVMAKIIDVGISSGDTAYILKMGGIMVLLGIVGLGCALVCQYFAAVASQGFGTVLRNDLYRHINTFSFRELDRFSTSSLITRVTNDINQMQFAVAMLIRLVVRAPFLAIGSIIMAMLLDLRLSLVFLIATPLIALILLLITKRTVPVYKNIQKKLDQLSQVSRENLEGIRVIRAFSRQKQEQKRFEEANDDFTKASLRVTRISALLNPLTFTVMNVAIIAIVWLGAGRVFSGTLMQGQIIALVNYITQTLLAMIVVANLVVIFTKASASAARINEVLDTETSIADPEHPAAGLAGNQKEPSDKPTAKDALKTSGSEPAKIQLKDVSFAYHRNGEDAVEEINLSIQTGETVGIIGPTGSGKSTLVNLIPRFYDVQKGRLLVDGIDVKQYALEDLRSKIGLVLQHTVLFSGTVRENLLWGQDGASDDDLLRALATAQALDFVEKMPQKLDTHIDQSGKNLSGGQKQRLTIARALVRDPEILILDDSASALDYKTDADLREALRRENSGRTVLIVSQRAASVKDLNRIVVLEEGRTVGIGTHNELLERCPVYREICVSQNLETEADAV